MESAYLFLLAAVVFSGLFGAFVRGPRWVPAALCSAVPVVTLISLYAMRSTHGLLETVAAASPILIAMALVYLALGYIGATFGNRYRPILSKAPVPGSEEAETKSKWPLYLALFIAFPVIGSFLASVVPAITSAWQRIFP
jgi:hypothetical protein